MRMSAGFLCHMDSIERAEKRQRLTNRYGTKTCPACGRTMYPREGKNGVFFGCSGYPNCKKTLNI